MKRVLPFDEEKEPLVDDLILYINTKVAQSDVVIMGELLAWHSINKLLYRKWLDRDYLSKLMKETGKRSLEIFQKERHGFYLENYKTLSLYSHVFTMVGRVFSDIINQIRIEEQTITKEYWYKSPNDLTINQLVPVALHPVKERLIILLSSYMKDRYGWIVETQSRRQPIISFGETLEVSLLVTVRPIGSINKTE